MKKLILLLLFIPLVSLGQVSESYHPNGTIKSRQVIASETGVLIQYYENGNIQSKFQFYAKNTFSNGEVFGIKGDFIYDKIQKTYFEEGGVSNEVIVKKSFNSSKKDYSETKKFNTNGSLIEEGIYREGQKDGYFKFFWIIIAINFRITIRFININCIILIKMNIILKFNNYFFLFFFFN